MKKRWCSSGFPNEGCVKRNCDGNAYFEKTKSSIEPSKMQTRSNFNVGVTSGSARFDGPITESGQNLNRSSELTGSALGVKGIRTPRKPRRKNCNLGVRSIPQLGKKRRGQFANSTDDGDVGDASSRKGMSNGKKMKCLPVDNLEFAEEAQPVVEYIESSSEDSVDDDVVDAMMLLSIQPDAQCTGPSFNDVCSSDYADRLDDDLNGSELMPDHPSRPKENRLPIVHFRKRFRKKDDGYLLSVADRLQIQDSDKEDVLIECKIDPKKLMWSIGSNGSLELNVALIPFQEFNTQLSLPVCPLLDFPFGSSQLFLLQQYGKIVSMWPKVYLEMLLVDNEVGLRFFLLEGCLRQAVAYVFVVLTLFCDTNKLGEYVEGQIPVCSVRFKLSCVQDLRKHHAFTFYSYSKLKHSNWLYLNSVFQKRCLISKKLPLPECTLENIRALKGESKLPMNYLIWESSQGSRRKNFKDFVPISLTKFGKENGRQARKCTVKHGMLPFALSYSAAPLFFRSLHLKLLMRSTLACVRLGECTLACSMELRGNTCNSTTICCAVPKHCSEIFRQVFPGSTSEPYFSGKHHSGYHLETHPETASLNCYGVISSQHKSFGTTSTRNSSTLPLGEISSIWQGERTSDVYIGFGSVPRKPRTQVRYVMPSGESEFSSRHEPLNQDSQSFKRNRRAGQKRTFGDTKGSQRNLELLACNSNVLITLGDRCWRKSGMRVVLEFPDQYEWSLAVKFSGRTEYSHKVHHVFQIGSANRYTRAMMWKGAKDWALEFPDRSQWMLFKEMYEECYNRNIRVTKNVSIPGFHLVEESEAYTKKVSFTPSPSYIQQIENDIDMAMNPSKILYDMDSEDEHWISKNGKSFQSQETCCSVITDGIFEKCMDILEKFAYAQQRNHFTLAELEKLMVGVVPSEVIIAIYQHWKQKRKRTGMPLIRHLQPPSWERYQVKLQEWNQFTTKGKSIAVCGDEVKAPIVEKPVMFAFCLKPRGLKVPNKGSKCRSQKKVHAAGRRHANIGEQVRDEMASYHRPGKRSRVQPQEMELPDWPSQKRQQSELYRGKGNLHLGVRDSDEFRMREASGAAKRAVYIAVLKWEKAQRLRLKADYAINVAASALTIASALKASYCPTD